MQFPYRNPVLLCWEFSYRLVDDMKDNPDLLSSLFTMLTKGTTSYLSVGRHSSQRINLYTHTFCGFVVDFSKDFFLYIILSWFSNNVNGCHGNK